MVCGHLAEEPGCGDLRVPHGWSIWLCWFVVSETYSIVFSPGPLSLQVQRATLAHRVDFTRLIYTSGSRGCANQTICILHSVSYRSFDHLCHRGVNSSMLQQLFQCKQENDFGLFTSYVRQCNKTSPECYWMCLRSFLVHLYDWTQCFIW